ncbi:uncharacterized protein LOC109724346 [Ananas comosus]|uniref:Uncharacterized protein LOC109724346 n=1 Tax=Ananas comosus TaxID=4615 RepID=A0A199W528_ANACO|nr:uncharacterized protein LOC109724346 [Ananas comosus]OAY84592.1 hypothetical protein ACMD2_23321 [Ananas comosus]
MDSTFYDPESGDGEGAQLGVYVHHARGIHNICIYASQDVYAKLSLTRSPDEAVSTRVAAGGGANPRFDELVAVGRVASPRSAVLKCEIWMLSRARSLLDDQLLGFALVPLSSVAAAAGRSLTQDFSLSSTDLFHSPAGTVRLTLSLDSPPATAAAAGSTAPSSAGITSEVVILDPADYRRLEPPDVAVEEENRRMVAEYFDIMSPASTATAAPLLRLDSDYDMTSPNSPDDDPSSFASSATTTTTTTSLSDESKKIAADSSSSSNSSSLAAEAVGTPTSKPGAVVESSCSKLENEHSKDRKAGAELGSVFESPMGNISLEAEQAAMQQQIVEMYMKSMQQFTESLAKMKLPMDLDNPRPDDDRGAVIQSQNNDNNNNDTKLDVEEKNKKKDGSRVFYGSRAFF